MTPAQLKKHVSPPPTSSCSIVPVPQSLAVSPQELNERAANMPRYLSSPFDQAFISAGHTSAKYEPMPFMTPPMSFHSLYSPQTKGLSPMLSNIELTSAQSQTRHFYTPFPFISVNELTLGVAGIKHTPQQQQLHQVLVDEVKSIDKQPNRSTLTSGTSPMSTSPVNNAMDIGVDTSEAPAKEKPVPMTIAEKETAERLPSTRKRRQATALNTLSVVAKKSYPKQKKKKSNTPPNMKTSEEDAACTCGKSDNVKMIEYSTCSQWSHYRCVGLTTKRVNEIGDDDWVCQLCSIDEVYSERDDEKRNDQKEAECSDQSDRSYELPKQIDTSIDDDDSNWEDEKDDEQSLQVDAATVPAQPGAAMASERAAQPRNRNQLPG